MKGCICFQTVRNNIIVIGAVEYAVKTHDGVAYPCEIGLAKISLQEGFWDIENVVVNPQS